MTATVEVLKWTGIFIILLIFVVGWALVVFSIIRDYRRKKAMEKLGIDHISLYFDDYFGVIAKNFGLVRKDKLDLWSRDINARLGKVDDDISFIQSFRDKFDPRLEKLEKRVNKLSNQL